MQTTRHDTTRHDTTRHDTERREKKRKEKGHALSFVPNKAIPNYIPTILFNSFVQNVSSVGVNGHFDLLRTVQSFQLMRQELLFIYSI